ncbi:MAG: biotin transporter BioY [Sphingosinicella sp.]|nr:biotin transporter BioY [Sphingosinicella sp.]
MTADNPGQYGQSLLAIGLGALVMAAASQIEIALTAVPLTTQSFAALSLGGFLGWRLGGAALLLWLLLGASGLPFFADGKAGFDHLTGATAGYLLAFPIAAALAGWLTATFAAKSLPRLFYVMLAGHALCLVSGTFWLATRIGTAKAIEVGMTPFLLGAILKSALAALTVAVLLKVRSRRPASAEAI